MTVDMETCSWCFDEVPNNTLREQSDGARICRRCAREARAERAVKQDRQARNGW